MIGFKRIVNVVNFNKSDLSQMPRDIGVIRSRWPSKEEFVTREWRILILNKIRKKKINLTTKYYLFEVIFSILFFLPEPLLKFQHIKKCIPIGVEIFRGHGRGVFVSIHVKADSSVTPIPIIWRSDCNSCLKN